jgi:two-component system chemotaxis response regulator CheY
MKILVVDDSSIMRRILKMAITKVDPNIEIYEAENGKEGIEVLEKNDDMSYTFLDINMPIMKGDEMLKIVRSRDVLKHHKIIIQTTEGRREKFIELKQLGISGYIVKPYTQEIVEQLLTKLVEKEAATA